MHALQPASLLVELLTEELPPKALIRLSDAFASGLGERLAAAGLVDAAARVTPYATPRRLAVTIDKVLARAPDRIQREKLLPVSVGLDALGQPTAPLRKKLAALGLADVPVDQLERATDGKSETLFVARQVAGASLADALQRALEETLGKLPIPKTMSYQLRDGDTVRFVRPAHRLLALLGDAIVDVSVLGLRAGRTTQGHRFLSQGEIEIDHADRYVDTLRQQGKVLADRMERREAIRAQLVRAAGGDRVLAPDSLLDEVNALVEWPVVYACRFDEDFLAVPQECLILTMQTNQKYFALTDDAGTLRSRFLVVSNIETATPHDIIEGNERVVRPRLADAKFFFEQDRKKPLADRVALLANVVYHNKLGTQLDRVERVAALAAGIAPLVGADPAHAARAGRLAKADLTTDMVGEFPELQGTMGTYYARHDGEPDDVALACSEHYRPRFAGDALPSTATGTAVALADKLETLTGIWGIGLAPTGEKDPFALRRHALGVLRLLIENALPVELDVLLRMAHARFVALPQVADSTAALYAFLLDRLRGLLRERGYTANEIEAVLSQNPTRLDDLVERLDAVRAFAALPEATALAAANKRITNILKKAETVPTGVAANLLSQTAEQALFEQLERLTPDVQAHLSARRYTGALAALAGLRANVDTFFDEVMVNAEDDALRGNRLALLARLHAQMNCVADISKLAA